MEMYSIVPMLFCPAYADCLKLLVEASGIKEVVLDSDGFVLQRPEEYHLSLAYIELKASDWKRTIAGEVEAIVRKLLADHRLLLQFKQIAVLDKYFFVQFNEAPLRDFRTVFIKRLKELMPSYALLYQQEYFPHVTLGQFTGQSQELRILKKEAITTKVNQRSLIAAREYRRSHS